MQHLLQEAGVNATNHSGTGIGISFYNPNLILSQEAYNQATEHFSVNKNLHFLLTDNFTLFIVIDD
jgi:hypothetical protein